MTCRCSVVGGWATEIDGCAETVISTMATIDVAAEVDAVIILSDCNTVA